MATTASSVGTKSSVVASASAVALLAANAERSQASFYNDSSDTLYLSLGDTEASATSFTAKLAAGGYYELPTAGDGAFTGQVRGIWSGTNGAVRVTELT